MSRDLDILLIEDDGDNLDLLVRTLPHELAGCSLHWDPCPDFDEAVSRLGYRHYDLVVTDIYRDDPGTRLKGKSPDSNRVREIIATIRNKRFCPIIAFTDGTFPAGISESPFLKLADKSRGNADIEAKVTDVISTGIPELGRRLYDDLDGQNGLYLWEFLETNWARMSIDRTCAESVLRKRAAICMSRLLGGTPPAEREVVEPAEFYIYPPISGSTYRLGDIVRSKNTREFRVLLTPHCHLETQPGEAGPRAEHVLTLRTVDAGESLKSCISADESRRWDCIRRKIQSPSSEGKPAGRYWFLPAFLDVPNLYCDFCQIESIRYQSLGSDFDRIATLDSPFAEAVQSCFVRFYLSVGLPILNPERFDLAAAQAAATADPGSSAKQ